MGKPMSFWYSGRMCAVYRGAWDTLRKRHTVTLWPAMEENDYGATLIDCKLHVRAVNGRMYVLRVWSAISKKARTVSTHKAHASEAINGSASAEGRMTLWTDCGSHRKKGWASQSIGGGLQRSEVLHERKFFPYPCHR